MSGVSIDYTSFAGPGQKPPDGSQANHAWWTLKGKELAASVTAVLSVLDGAQRSRVQQLLQNARLYGSLPPGMRPPIAVNKERQGFNVIQSGIDTLTSKLAKNKPKPLFLTSGGNYKQQRKAKRLNQFVEGLFYENKAYDLGVRAFRSACIDGDGLIHVFERHGRVCFERVPAGELIVDEVEALYGLPRSMHWVRSVDRNKLIAEVGHKKQIAEANPAQTEDRVQRPQNIADSVKVRESWHLPSGPEEDDGRHAITIDGEVLLDEKWQHEWFPFARFQLCAREYGYWGQGIAEQGMPIQIRINKLAWAVDESYDRAGMAVIFLENGSKVVKSHITNLPGTIVPYVGTKPSYETPPILPPEVYQRIESLKQSFYEQIGISMLSANSEKPAGLNSGKALREYNDIESDRFMTLGHAYENLFLEMARLGIATANDIAKREGGYRVKTPGRGRATEIDWNDIDLAEDSYVMQCFPVSSLPNEPAGRFQTIQEWVQAGWYTARQGKKLMNFPDLESVDSLEQAAEDWLTLVLDKIVDEGIATPPEPFDDLALAYELGLEYYQQGKIWGLEPERLELLRRWLGQVQAFQAQAQQQAAAMAAAMQGPAANGGSPQATPMPPPQSDILPNSPQAAA